MNTICMFRITTLSDEYLVKSIDQKTDKMFSTGEIPSRTIPAKPDEDYDILVGELLLRFI